MKSIFIVGSGKCGETFLNKILKKDSIIDSYDENRPLLQSYYKFIKYNKLKIDDAPFFLSIKKAIKNSNKNKKIYLESSSFLAFHAHEFAKKFNSKIIILLRNPINVSKDLINSGWYKKKYYKSNNNHVLGYQGISTSFSNKHHNFSRIAPNGKFFSKWNKLNSLIKSKWYWNEVNEYLLINITKKNKKNYKIIRIEDFKFEKYKELCNWLKIRPKLSKIKFDFLCKIENLKKIEIEDKERKLLRKYKSKIEKKYYPENLK